MFPGRYNLAIDAIKPAEAAQHAGEDVYVEGGGCQCSRDSERRGFH
jgi:hypothetical protein